jgi:uncharacterized membrane protein (DUF106 family)
MTMVDIENKDFTNRVALDSTETDKYWKQKQYELDVKKLQQQQEQIDKDNYSMTPSTLG